MAMYTQVRNTAGYVGLNALGGFRASVLQAIGLNMVHFRIYHAEFLQRRIVCDDSRNVPCLCARIRLRPGLDVGSTVWCKCLSIRSGLSRLTLPPLQIVAPFAAQRYVENESAGVLWLATGGIWLAMLVLIFLPIETRNRQAF